MGATWGAVGVGNDMRVARGMTGRVAQGSLLPCHSERSVSGVRNLRRSSGTRGMVGEWGSWILRCAQNDKGALRVTEGARGMTAGG